jgi:hypothetical protein
MKKCDVKKYLMYLKDRRKKIKIKNENCCKNKKYDTDEK